MIEGPDNATVESEFPKVVRFPATNKFVIMGVRLDNEISLETIHELDEAGILVRWPDGSLYKDVE